MKKIQNKQKKIAKNYATSQFNCDFNYLLCKNSIYFGREWFVFTFLVLQEIKSFFK